MTGVQTCALPICTDRQIGPLRQEQHPRAARQEETPRDKIEREIVTRENYGKTEKGRH